MEGNKALPLQIFRESMWWIIAAVVAVAVLFPIFQKVHYEYWKMNSVIIFMAVLYFLYIIFYRQSVLLRPKWLRFLVFIFNLNFFVFVIRQSQFYISIYDSFTVADLGILKAPLSFTQMEKLYQYFLFETTFAVVACLLMIATLNARMIFAYWQTAKTRLNGGETE